MSDEQNADGDVVGQLWWIIQHPVKMDDIWVFEQLKRAIDEIERLRKQVYDLEETLDRIESAAEDRRFE